MSILHSWPNQQSIGKGSRHGESGTLNATHLVPEQRGRIQILCPTLTLSPMQDLCTRLEPDLVYFGCVLLYKVYGRSLQYMTRLECEIV